MKLPVDNAFGLNYNEKDITGRLCIACIRENNCYMLYLDKEENNCDSSEELKTSPFFVARINVQIKSVRDSLTKKHVRLISMKTKLTISVKLVKNRSTKLYVIF